MNWFKSKNKTPPAASKSDFVVVLHYWHVHSRGFTQHVFKDMTREQVEKEAKVLQVDKSGDFCSCAYTIVEFKE